MTTIVTAATNAATVSLEVRVDGDGRLGRDHSPVLPVLEVDGVSVCYTTRTGTVEAVREVSLAVRAGETVGIVGESGSGKSTLAYAIMGYLGENGRVAAGSIRLNGQELVDLSPDALRNLRGARMAMVYQDPQTALNPALTIGEQVAEARATHSGEPRADCWRRAVELLGKVGLPDPERIAARYPHQLSGGQQQRVVIAMALVNDPALLIMDEPTTGLDVTTEALILDLVNTLKRELDAAILYISHNLGVIAQVCDRVAVMYAAEMVEEADVVSLFREPRHPYTVALLGCVPQPDLSKESGSLRPIPGQLPSYLVRSQGCVFAPRCELARDRCLEVTPDLARVEAAGEAIDAGVTRRTSVTGGDIHRSRCHFWPEVPGWAREIEAREDGEVTDERHAAAAGGNGAARATRARDAVVIQLPTHQPEAPRLRHEARETVLEVKGLRRDYGGTRGLLGRLLRPITGPRPVVRAVDDVSFTLAAGETLALVGESGCGKTTLARTIAGLNRPTAGTIRFLGHDVSVRASQRPTELRRHLQMVFQNPDASLNPRHTVGQIVGRPLEKFLGLRGQAARERVVELLDAVRMGAGYLDRYPRHLSGGEKQRVSIARAFAGDPLLVVCDEAVSSLDVSVQATILNLLVRLQQERGTSYLFISHDLSVVRYLADRIGVMYLGKLVEVGRAEDLLRPPYHPYTEALLSAVPVPDPQLRRERIRLRGPVPSPTERPVGCPFAGRCPRYLGSVCDEVPPPVQDAGNGHQIACHIPLEQLANPAPIAAPVPAAN